MKHILLLCLLAFSTHIRAKAPEIYRCLQKDGSVIIQDRRCLETRLQEVKPLNQKKRVLNQPSKTQRTQNNRSQLQLPRDQARRPNQLAKTKPRLNSGRSPYFVFGWDRFIPANWVIQKINTRAYQEMLLSRTQFKSVSDFSHGVKLSVYPETMQTSRLDAFAQALQLYHQIRDNSNLKLLDSQFKTHPKYKVFNIKYQNQRQQLLLTEFYIDERNNDLFVVTVQAKETEWSSNWQLAENIISQL